MIMPAISESCALEMLRPPINRAMRVLDRSFFKKSLPTSAARVLDRKQISKCRNELHYDILHLDRMLSVVPVQDSHGADAKALLLKPNIRSDGEPIPLAQSDRVKDLDC